MPGDNYVVNYDIRVLSEDAVQSIGRFVAATQELTKAQGNFSKINQSLNSLTQRMAAFNQKAPTVRINVKPALDSVNQLIARLEKAEALMLRTGAMPLGGVVGKGAKAPKVPAAAASAKSTPKAPKIPAPAASTIASTRSSAANINRTVTRMAGRQSIGQLKNNVLGKTLIDTGGVGIFDFVKGMGIAYGIAGLGTAFSNVIKDATEYNNIIQTTKNILGTHDKRDNFQGRFSAMEKLIRRVGIETKFTAPEVADASKFLAMAGYNIDAINRSIRPIADIALVGDTDLGRTADVVTNIMTGYNIAPERMRHAADVMTMTFTKSNTTLEEIAESYKYAASILSLGGTRFEEATAAIGILGDAGIKGSQAGTTLRAIATNIAKPTKAQQAAWDAIGISRLDENGKRKNLVDIFQELHDKNVDIDVFGRLFHRTALSGAAALAAHVDKWNEIIRLNFMSDGLSSQLAEEKKNTIQGLWYQLTSSFTEAGMKAFEDNESGIRDILKKGISWLQSDEAINAIKRIAKTIGDLAETLLHFTKIIWELYQRFEGVITLWLKFQVYAKLALIPMRIINSVRDFGIYLMRMAGGMRAVTASSMAMNSTFGRGSFFGGANAMSQTPFLFRAYQQGSQDSFMRAYSQHALNRGIYGNDHYLAVRDRYYNIQRSRLMNVNPMIGGIGGILGSVAGAYFGSKVGEMGTVGNGLATVGGSILGYGVGNWLLTNGARLFNILGTVKTGFGGILGTLGGVVGVAGGAAAAIAALGLAMYKNYQETERATQACREFLSATGVVNGISYSESATNYDKYMRDVVDKQLTANQALAEYIKLRKEEMGLNNAAAEAVAGKTFGEEGYEGIIKNFDRAHKGFKTLFDWHGQANLNEVMFPVNGVVPAKQVSASSSDFYRRLGTGYRGFNTGKYPYGNFLTWKGVDFIATDNADYDETIRQVAGSQMGYKLGDELFGKGQYGNTIFEKYLAEFKTAESVEDFNTILHKLQSENIARLRATDSASKWWSPSQYQNAQITSAYWPMLRVNEILEESFNPASGKALGQISYLFNALQSGGDKFNPVEYLGQFGEGLKYFQEQYGEILTPEWLENLFFKNGEWQAGDLKDASGQVIQTFRKGESSKIMIQMYNDILSIMDQFSPQIAAKFQELLNRPEWGLSYNTVLPVSEERKKLGDTWYTYRNGMWVPDNGVMAPMNNAEFQRQLQSGGSSSKFTLEGTGAGSGSGGHGGGNGGYTNQYRSQSATPKQIIVKIENLMNVESVDMSDPNVAATVNNLKQQMAQALIEVVADFDANAANLV